MERVIRRLEVAAEYLGRVVAWATLLMVIITFVVVLLRFLGQENRVEIDISEIEPKRRRGTRGRGRKISYRKKDK